MHFYQTLATVVVNNKDNIIDILICTVIAAILFIVLIQGAII